MKTQQNTLVESPHDTTDTANGQATRFPRCRSKAEIYSERMSWALWAAGVYKRASDKEKQQMHGEF